MTSLLDKDLQSLTQHATDSVNAKARDLRGTMEPGDGWAQGDILVRRLADLPAGLQPIEPQAQLVPGTTQGSRHCLSSLAGVEMFAPAHHHPLLGPVFQVDHDVTITHPEHGHPLLGPGVYAIEYQRASGDALRRVED